VAWHARFQVRAKLVERVFLVFESFGPHLAALLKASGPGVIFVNSAKLLSLKSKFVAAHGSHKIVPIISVPAAFKAATK